MPLPLSTNCFQTVQFLAIAPRHNVKRAIKTLELVQQSLAGNDCNVNAQVLLSVQNTITDLNLALAGLSVTYRNPSDSACTAVSELYAFRHLSVDENQAGFVKSDIVNITSHRTPGGKSVTRTKERRGLLLGIQKCLLPYPLLPTPARLCTKVITMCA